MDKPIHFRRCHICGGLSQSQAGTISTCEYCGKSLAPFYYFDDRFVAIPSEDTLRPPLAENEYSPIQGLTVYWESF